MSARDDRTARAPETEAELAARETEAEAQGWGARLPGWRVMLGWLLVLLAAALFGYLSRQLGRTPAFAFDGPILSWFNDQRSATATALAHTLDLVGIAYALGAAALAISAAIWRDHARSGRFLLIAFLGAVGLNLSLKLVFSRPRPDLFESLITASNTSFPSGHAMGSWAFALALALVLARLAPPLWAWLGGVLLVLFAVAVGMSRIYLQVHYPSDVLAGWAASTVWVLVLTEWYRRGRT